MESVVNAPVSLQSVDLNRLGPQEKALLSALVDCHGRVVGRRELARRAGLHYLNERRCDSLLVAIRRSLGPNSIQTVRSRGWMISADYVDQARNILTG